MKEFGVRSNGAQKRNGGGYLSFCTKIPPHTELDHLEINQMVHLDVFKFFKRYNEFLFKRILHHNEMM